MIFRIIDQILVSQDDLVGFNAFLQKDVDRFLGGDPSGMGRYRKTGLPCGDSCRFQDLSLISNKTLRTRCDLRDQTCPDIRLVDAFRQISDIHFGDLFLRSIIQPFRMIFRQIETRGTDNVQTRLLADFLQFSDISAHVVGGHLKSRCDPLIHGLSDLRNNFIDIQNKRIAVLADPIQIHDEMLMCQSQTKLIRAHIF